MMDDKNRRRHGCAPQRLCSIAAGEPAQQISGEFNISREVREMSTEDLVAVLAQHGVTARGEPDESESLH
jgi:hypothetical protein